MAAGCRVLDGGLATCLEKISGREFAGDPLWSARLLATNPDLIVAAHEAFVRAGADVITTASYQASVDGFAKHLGLDQRAALGLIRLSVDLAKKAVDNCGLTGKVMIAGSVGPYGACLADGSEYTGSYLDDYSVTDENLRDWHRPRIQALLEAGADVLAVETMPGLREVEAVLSVLREFPNARAWVAFSCRDGRFTSHGEDVGAAAGRVARLACAAAGGNGSASQLLAVGVNCCRPGDVTALLTRVRSSVLPELGLVAYPNSGEVYEPTSGRFFGTPCDLASFAPEWRSVGAELVGGCCRVYPDDVRRIKEALGSSSGGLNSL